MIKVIVITILLYPHIALIWKLLSVLGFVFIVILILGFIIYSFKGKPAKFRELKLKPIIIKKLQRNSLKTAQSSGSLLDVKPFGSQLLYNTNSQLQMILHSMIKELAIDQLSVNKFTKQILNHLMSNPTKLGSSTQLDAEEMSIMDSYLQTFLHVSMDLFHSTKGQNLYEMLWVNGLECLCEHIKLYRNFRKQIEQESNVLIQEDYTRHLDDFNDYSVENDDENIKWSQNVDKIHELMILRLRAAGKLHCAIGKGPEEERTYLRKLANECLEIFNASKVPTSPSKMLQIIIREWIVCKGVWPLMHKLSQPNVVNQAILEKTNKKLIIQKAVRKFCSKLESDHTQFPPVFLISHYVPQKFSMGEKLRYLDVIGKYARKATSVIDINAVRHEILREMKKERDDLEELKGHGDWDAHKRYYRTLESVQRKLEKRLKALASDSRSITQGIIRANSSKEPAKEQKELSLNSILEKYFKSSEEKGDMHSTSLFYFLDFLEKKHDGKSLTMLRFWAATEKYKRLVWRIGVGLLNEPSNLYNEEKVEEFTSATHSRLQKEVAKIYETFITNQTLLKLSPQVLDAYQRYIQPLTTPDSKYYADDYLCVFKTQKRLQEELEQVFEGFLHSNSFFQWSSETQKSKIIQDIPLLNQSDAFIVGDEDWVDVFEESALMNSLEDALFDACGRVTGIRQKPERDQFGSTEALSFLNSIITLEDIVIDREVSKDELDYDQSSPTKDDDDGDMHAPGELVTHSSKLAQINQSMDRVLHQIDCLNLLSRKVNRSKSDTDHLYIMQSHIIEEAKDYLGQEIGDLSKQKAKLESQEQREALMPGQCFVTIQELDDAEEEGVGKKVTFYLITVVEQRKLTSGWTVKRRYSDFDALHQKLREEFEMVNDFELPSKTLGLGILSRSKAEMKAIRLKALEKYLQRLIDNRDISKSDHVRNFLSSNYKPEDKKLFRDFKNEIITAPNETLKRTQQKLAKTLSQFSGKKKEPLNKVLSFLEPKKKDSTTDIDDLGAENMLGEKIGSVPMGDEVQSDSSEEDLMVEEQFLSSTANHPIVFSIIQVLINLFDFKEQHTWLRDNAALSVLHQFLGNKGSVESSVIQLVKSFVSDDFLVRFLKKYKDYVTKPSLLDTDTTVPTASIRIDTKVKVLAVFSATQARILGNEASYQGHVLLVEMLQSEELNKQFLFSLLDSSLDLVKKFIA